MLHALYHAASETTGLLGSLLTKHRIPFQENHLYRGDTVPLQSNTSGLIVMGGPMNVDEVHLYPFLDPEIKLIEQTIRAGKPVLGICLGSQLIAKALGEKVYPNPQREVGWHPIQLTSAAQDDPMFLEMPPVFDVLHWHGDTFNLPRNAVHLAFSNKCRHQAFRYGKNVYGLQFHLEVTPEMVKDWIKTEGSADYIRGAHEEPGDILQQTANKFTALEPLATQIFEQYIPFLR